MDRRSIILRWVHERSDSVASKVFAEAIDAAAVVYAVARQLAGLARAFGLRHRAASLDGPPEIYPDAELDIVDQASWESFPASDAPGY